MILAAGLFPILMGASSTVLAEVRKRIVNGLLVTEHIDEDGAICGNGKGATEGCHALLNPGGHHVWFSSNAPQYVIDHEYAHVDGMEHSPWQAERDGFFGTKNCAIVTRAGGGYDLYTKICNTGGTETREKRNGFTD